MKLQSQEQFAKQCRTEHALKQQGLHRTEWHCNRGVGKFCCFFCISYCCRCFCSYCSEPPRGGEGIWPVGTSSLFPKIGNVWQCICLFIFLQKTINSLHTTYLHVYCEGTFVWVDGSDWSSYGNWISNQPASTVTDASEKQVLMVRASFVGLFELWYCL